jgi:uncharacterized protein
MSKILTILAAAILSSTALAAPAVSGDTADKNEAIQAIFNAINMNAQAENFGKVLQLDAQNNTASALQGALMDNKELTLEQKKDKAKKLEAILPSIQAKVGNTFIKPSFKQRFIQESTAQYAKVYSAEDLKALAAFYQTETGKKFISSQDKIITNTIGTMKREFFPPAIEELKNVANNAIKNIK